MTHFFLLGLILLMPVGAIVLARLKALHRIFPQPPIKSYTLFILFFFVYTTITFTHTYLRINLQDAPLIRGMLAAPAYVFPYTLLLLFLVGLSYHYFLKTLGHFVQTPPLSLLQKTLQALVPILIILRILQGLFPQTPIWARLFLSSLLPFRYFSLAILFLLLFLARRHAGKDQPRDGRSASLHTFVLCTIPQEAFDVATMILADSGLMDGPLWNVLSLGVILLTAHIWTSLFLVPILERERQSSTTGRALQILIARFNLSPRESETVQYLTSDLSNKEIAGRMDISASTVKNHIYNVYQKMGISSRFELIDAINREQTPSNP